MSRIALILGAGIGGIVAAEELRRRLPPEDRVIVVERNREHVFPPSLLWLLSGDREAAEITKPLARLERRGIEVVFGEIERLEPEVRAVEIGGRRLSGDAMIVALGAELAPETIPGLAASGHNLFALDGASAARNVLAEFSGGTIAVMTASPIYKCPAGPYEAAFLVDDLLRRTGRRDKSRIVFFAAEPMPMPVAGPAMAAALREMLAAREIAYHPNSRITGVDPARRRLSFADGADADFDLLLFVPPHRAPKAVRESGLAGESGWIPVDRATLATRFPEVFAIGDVTTIPLAMGRPLPKAGVFAHGQAETVAANIAARWTGGGEERHFDGRGACFIETGSGRAGMGSGDFYAEPLPAIRLRQPSRLWHAGKVLFEKYWLYSRF
ncbi:MAG: NAD(P)/FAD-dependent oxidoreductase [Alphaproteobacteria bacterium]|nr:NAD(P)/FAD-dependent oxidoreductase [Alphaproteobacteria bacterium]